MHDYQTRLIELQVKSRLRVIKFNPQDVVKGLKQILDLGYVCLCIQKYQKINETNLAVIHILDIVRCYCFVVYYKSKLWVVLNLNFYGSTARERTLLRWKSFSGFFC